ncbi:MAG: hypothetical protein ABEJ31_05680 [Haloarculaceae archaeon]
MSRRETARGQSHVVGVALLLGVAVISMAGLTAGIGALVERNAASADAARVADDLDAALEPVEATGHHAGTVTFASGRLHAVDRQLRVLNGSRVVRTVETDGLVFAAGDRRVAYVADAVVRGSGAGAWLVDPPQVTAGEPGGTLIVSAPRLNASDVSVGGNGATTATLRTDVAHHRTALGNGTFAVAIETETPAPLARWFRRRNASVTRTDFDGDGIDSVVARSPGRRVGYLVVHDLHLEVAG